MSLLLSAIGFCVQLIAIASIISIVTSCVFSSFTNSALISEDHPSGAELSVSVDESDATLSDTARVTCAKSMASPVYVTTIDEPSGSPDDYSAMTVVALKALCKDRRIKGYSSLRKHELVALLSAS